MTSSEESPKRKTALSTEERHVSLPTPTEDQLFNLYKDKVTAKKIEALLNNGSIVCPYDGTEEITGGGPLSYGLLYLAVLNEIVETLSVNQMVKEGNCCWRDVIEYIGNLNRLGFSGSYLEQLEKSLEHEKKLHGCESNLRCMEVGCVSDIRCMKVNAEIYAKIAVLIQECSEREQRMIDDLQQTLPATKDDNNVRFRKVFH